ncbi:MAG: hypothetical protein BGO69_05110 [Bacteroidetes bacterium 46-16]|nr:MAG: hypothetical protein BGO69_05110 [Bacteroidetes bacterium 46-16]
MDVQTFTIEIEERKFLFEKVWTGQEDFYLYILPYDKDEKGFFMSKDTEANWKVLHRFIVAPYVIRMEDILSEMINKELGK